MNILILYDKENKEIESTVYKLIKENDKRINLNKSNINFFEKKIPRRKIHIYVLVLNKIDELQLFLQHENILKTDKLCILTSNFDSEFVLKCIEVTPNIYYIENDINYILDKIINVSNKSL